MNPDELADRMRQGEVFHSLRMLRSSAPSDRGLGAPGARPAVR